MKGTTRQADVTIGLDLGDKRSQAVVLDASGEEIEDRSIAKTREAFGRALKEYAGCVLVMEVGTHSPWASLVFKARGFRVIVANPRQVRLISASQHKSDHFEAHMLARLGRAAPSSCHRSNIGVRRRRRIVRCCRPATTDWCAAVCSCSTRSVA